MGWLLHARQTTSFGGSCPPRTLGRLSQAKTEAKRKMKTNQQIAQIIQNLIDADPRDVKAGEIHPALVEASKLIEELNATKPSQPH
jgi:hypothetical protein